MRRTARVRGLAALAVLVFGAGACSEGGRTLLLDVRSDLVPGVEFVGVRSQRLAALPAGSVVPAVVRTVDRAAAPTEDFVTGQRVASFSGLGRGDHAVRVQLLSAGGAVALERTALVTVSHALTVTLVLTRDCRGVECPTGDDPTDIACVGGQCVNPRCTPESGEFCPAPACTVDGECAGPVPACASAVCSDGRCLVRRDDDSCDDGSYCHPSLGCSAWPRLPMDGPVPDAGMDASRDAAVDAPGDAGVLDGSRDAAAGDGGRADGAIDGGGTPDAGPRNMPPVATWGRTWGAAGRDEGLSVAVDLAGDVYLLGTLADGADLGTGPLSSADGTVFVASYDPLGTPRWVRPLAAGGGALSARPGGGVVLAGTFASADFGLGPTASVGGNDAFVAAYGAGGAVEWVWQAGTGRDRAVGASVDPSGRTAVVGVFDDTVDLGAGPIATAGGAEGFVAVLDANGAALWGASLGAVSVAAIATDAAGELIVTGSFTGTVDFGTGPLTTTATELFLVRYDASGAVRWARQDGGALAQTDARSVTVATDGDVVVCGAYDRGAATLAAAPLVDTGWPSAFVARYGPDGSDRWARRLGGLEVNQAEAAKPLPGGAVAVTGAYGGTFDFGIGGAQNGLGFTDAFAIAYDAQGVPLWVTSFGDSGYDTSYALALAPDQSVVLAGSFEGVIETGTGVVQSFGAEDGFLLTLR